MAKLLTPTKAKLQEYIQASCCVPHPDVRYGSLFLDHPLTKDNREVCVSISPLSYIDLTGDVHIKAWTVISRGATILTHEHKFKSIDVPMILQEEGNEKDCTQFYNKTIESDVWIYAATILAKCTSIAKGVIVGVGSVVTHSIEEPYSIWAGVPAKQIGSRRC